MKYTQGIYPIIKKEVLAKGVYAFGISCPEVVQTAKAGQFVHIRIGSRTLRRPISICDIDTQKGTLTIVFEVRGKGTEELSLLNLGDSVDILGPLGNGFTVGKDFKKAVLVGGGIGTPPMLGLARCYGDKAAVISGFRNTDAVILQSDFKNTGARTILCTDDGSAGLHGFVTEPLKELLEIGEVDVVYACGPHGMLRGIYALCKANNVPCQVSLEERMGCGIGACLVCACRTVKNGDEYFAHVCKDGPVFNAEEVL